MRKNKNLLINKTPLHGSRKKGDGSISVYRWRKEKGFALNPWQKTREQSLSGMDIQNGRSFFTKYMHESR